MKRADALTPAAFLPGYEMMVTKATMADPFGFQVFRAEGMDDEQPSGEGQFPVSFSGFRLACRALSHQQRESPEWAPGDRSFWDPARAPVSSGPYMQLYPSRSPHPRRP